MRLNVECTKIAAIIVDIVDLRLVIVLKRHVDDRSGLPNLP
jgi:hypothetical protein